MANATNINIISHDALFSDDRITLAVMAYIYANNLDIKVAIMVHYAKHLYCHSSISFVPQQPLFLDF